MVLVLCNKLARLAGEHLLGPHVDADVLPVVGLAVGFEGTVATLVETLVFGRRGRRANGATGPVGAVVALGRGVRLARACVGLVGAVAVRVGLLHWVVLHWRAGRHQLAARLLVDAQVERQEVAGGACSGFRFGLLVHRRRSVRERAQRKTRAVDQAELCALVVVERVAVGHLLLQLWLWLLWLLLGAPEVAGRLENAQRTSGRLEAAKIARVASGRLLLHVQESRVGRVARRARLAQTRARGCDRERDRRCGRGSHRRGHRGHNLVHLGALLALAALLAAGRLGARVGHLFALEPAPKRELSAARLLHCWAGCTSGRRSAKR